MDNTVINRRNETSFAMSLNKIGQEERLIPTVRAHLARRLARDGLRVHQIATALNVTQPAVTQYIKGRRGRDTRENKFLEAVIDPLAEKIEKSVSTSRGGGVDSLELMEVARQLMVLGSGRKEIHSGQKMQPDAAASLNVLRERLQLELKAAEKYLDLCGRTGDEYTKLLLRLIASDSIRHGDIVSQIISWLELGSNDQRQYKAPNRELLEEMISLEDSASEVNLQKAVKMEHPIARLLLGWIDADEEKHEKTVKKIMKIVS